MDLGVMQMWVLIPLLPLTALNDGGQIIWYPPGLGERHTRLICPSGRSWGSASLRGLPSGPPSARCASGLSRTSSASVSGVPSPCPSFLISKMGEVIVTTSKLCIVEMCLACSKYSMSMLWLLVLSNRKLVLVLYFLDLYVTASLSIPFILKKPLVFLYLN